MDIVNLVGYALSTVNATQLAAVAAVLGLSALLGMFVSFRIMPDRYQFNVLQAHAFLASAGALFMLIIGGQIVTAVGLLGAASVVRYRYAIRSPRDAGTLIVALALGMSCGSGQIGLALVAAVFMTLVANLFPLLPSVVPFGLFMPRGLALLRYDARDFDEALKHAQKTLRKHHAVPVIRAVDRKDRERKGASVEIRFEVTYPIGLFDFDEVTQELIEEDVLRVSWEEPDAFRE